MRKNDYADERQSKLYTKFPSTHYLSNPKNVDHTLLWNTFFRRNLHRLAIDYLGIKLHLYQAIILYLMGISQFTVIIACRAAAKSFIISLWACCVCITRPFSKIVLSSGTKGQAKLIISEKIKNELMSMSPTLCKEILSIKDNQNDVIVYFKNGSTITVVVAGENGRGHRSNAVVREEFRQIDKKVDDSILSPFQTIRQAPYMIDTFYSGMTELQEEPVDIYISSSWYDNGHWMWDIVKQAQDEMLNSENYTACLLAFDESITLKHTIRSQKQMQKEKRKQDPLTWRLEFLNERIKENSAAFFTYKMFTDNQRNKKPFYPRSNSDVLMKKKNPYAIPKQQGEIRLVACDMAFVENKKNDNSVFSCIRLIPESRTYTIQSENGSEKEVNQGYRKIVSYLEPIQGGDTVKQAIRIKQLFEDFEADYTILDLRNGGIVVYDLLAKIMYDEERDKEYQPWVCMNDESVANRIKTVGALPILFAISASQKLNSEIALEFQTALTTNMIDFLVPLSEAQETILSKIPEYNTTVDTNLQIFYEKPFLETQALMNESTSLIYERKEQTGAIVISEQGNNRKDRYTSVSYGNHFACLLEQDLLSDNSDYDYATFIN
jgi:predicted DNA-binding antitoxin AbrB/MazE fold protein